MSWQRTFSDTGQPISVDEAVEAIGFGKFQVFLIFLAGSTFTSRRISQSRPLLDDRINGSDAHRFFTGPYPLFIRDWCKQYTAPFRDCFLWNDSWSRSVSTKLLVNSHSSLFRVALWFYGKKSSVNYWSHYKYNLRCHNRFCNKFLGLSPQEKFRSRIRSFSWFGVWLDLELVQASSQVHTNSIRLGLITLSYSIQWIYPVCNTRKRCSFSCWRIYLWLYACDDSGLVN